MQIKEYSIRIAGVGGQGIRLAGIILGTAATIEGKYASHWPSYGAETRGGPSISDVIISDSEIICPRVTFIDVLVLMASGFSNYVDKVKSGGLIILDEDLVKEEIKRNDVIVKKVPIMSVADKLKKRAMVNMVMLGRLISITRILNEESLIKSINMVLPEQVREDNIKAFKSGMV
ncbi:MAG: 2-oxoacid:acceptor oxidoreductase family protein [Nitrososphaerales archaeon]